MELVSSLGELISNQREFLALNSYPQTILFFKAFRDPSRDRIDVYVFMQKLTEMLEFQNSRDIQLFSRNVTSQTDNDQSSAVLRGQSLVKQREIMFDRTSIETCLLVTYKDCMRDKLTECFMKVLKNLKALERWAGRGLGEMS